MSRLKESFSNYSVLFDFLKKHDVIKVKSFKKFDFQNGEIQF